MIASRYDHGLGEPRQGRLRTDDGAELSYQSFGSGSTIVLANGIGVRYPGLAAQIRGLRDRYHVLCWDYRGIGDSCMPRDADVSIPRHARDLLAVLDHLEIEHAVVAGWSMGVQVALETARIQPERVSGLVALLGGYGALFHAVLSPRLARATERGFRLASRYPRVVQRVFDAAVIAPRLSFALMSRLSFVDKHVDQDAFAAMVRGVAQVDKRNYARTMVELAVHDASDMLAQLRCPALVVAGQRDWLTPPHLAEHMVERIPNAIYRQLPDSTHFGPLEKPERVNEWLLDFAQTVSWH